MDSVLEVAREMKTQADYQAKQGIGSRNDNPFKPHEIKAWAERIEVAIKRERAEMLEQYREQFKGRPPHRCLCGSQAIISVCEKCGEAWYLPGAMNAAIDLRKRNSLPPNGRIVWAKLTYDQAARLIDILGWPINAEEPIEAQIRYRSKGAVQAEP